MELKKTFDQIAAAEKSGSLSVEEKRKLEESVAEKVGGDLAWLFVVLCVTCLRRLLILLVFLLSFSRAFRHYSWYAHLSPSHFLS